MVGPKVTDSVHSGEALLKAIERISDAIKAVDPNISISPLARYSQTAADLGSNLENTVFRLESTNEYSNGGVGSAYWDPGGSLDRIDYRSIINSANNGFNSTNYPNSEGMNALVTHELGHLSSMANDFYQKNVDTWRNDPTQDHSTSSKFYTSDYAMNVERFANAVAARWAGVLGIKISTPTGSALPGSQEAPVEPSVIRAQHGGS